MFTASEISTWTWDIQENRVFADANFARMFGVSAEDASGGPIEHYLRAIHSDDRLRVEAAVTKTVQTPGRAYEIDYRLVQADGSIRWVIGRGLVECDDEGVPSRFTGLVIDITERKRTEEALRECHERYYSLFSSMAEGFCLIEVLYDQQERACDHLICEANPSFERHTGIKHPNGKKASELVPDLERLWTERYAEVVKTGDPIHLETRFEALDRWFDISAARVGGTNSHRVSVIFTDITARKRAEHDIAYQKKLLEALIESVADGIVIISPQGRLVHFNQHFLTIWKLPEELLQLKSDSAALEWAAQQTADPASFLAGVHAIYDRPDQTVWGEVAMKDGRVYERCGSPINHGNERLGWVWSFRDITERKRREEATRESEQRFRSLVSVITDVPWTTNAHGAFVTGQLAWSHYTGQESHAYCEFGWHDAMKPEDRERFSQAWAEAVRTRTTFEFRGQLFHAESQSHRHVMARAAPLFNPDGLLREWIGCCTDVHEQKTASERLECMVAERTTRLQETVSELESFSYSISHDLRAPLRAMQSFARFLEEEFGDQIGPQGKDYIRRIVVAADRMDRLI